jgi:hypothetical protein
MTSKDLKDLEWALAQLRHAYAQGAAGVIGDQRRFVDGLLARPIEQLERIHRVLLAADPRFCSAHQGSFQTSGCLVCGLAKVAAERETLAGALNSEAPSPEEGPINEHV